MLKLLHTYMVKDVPTDVLIELRTLEHFQTKNGLDRIVVHDAGAFETDGVTPRSGFDVMGIELAFADALNELEWGQPNRAQRLRFQIDARLDDEDVKVIVMIRTMRVHRNGKGLPKVILDDFDAFAADGVTVLRLDDIDSENIPLKVEELIEDALADPLLAAEAA